MYKIPEITQKDVETLVKFIKFNVRRTRCDGVVVGLSGGLDSAVTAKLAVRALNPENVYGFFMPSLSTPTYDFEDVINFSNKLGITLRMVDIQPIIDSLEIALAPEKQTSLDEGNMISRCRMIVLYNQARKRNCLVMGTSNKSEIMTGYFTKYGDGACDIMPLANFYKTQVRGLAEIIDIPEKFILKTPTAGLWIGQTDEEELKVCYRDLDLILYSLESNVSEEEIAESLGVPLCKVKEIRERVESSAHKRLPPMYPKFS
ncbi:MAG: NAD+ synthase [archaeon]|nr:NAD+ synthase [archaeon]